MNKTVGRNTSNARIRVARALATGAKTVPQVAALLDTTDGALRAAINGMERDGQIAKLAPPVTRRGSTATARSCSRSTAATRSGPTGCAHSSPPRG
jgi:predicted transcriptional regulator